MLEIFGLIYMSMTSFPSATIGMVTPWTSISEKISSEQKSWGGKSQSYDSEYQNLSVLWETKQFPYTDVGLEETPVLVT